MQQALFDVGAYSQVIMYEDIAIGWLIGPFFPVETIDTPSMVIFLTDIIDMYI